MLGRTRGTRPRFVTSYPSQLYTLGIYRFKKAYAVLLDFGVKHVIQKLILTDLNSTSTKYLE